VRQKPYAPVSNRELLMGWVTLVYAGLVEIAWSPAAVLRALRGGRLPAFALDGHRPVGTAYAVFTGIGGVVLARVTS
jgi:multidrug transporter EmrE-like cation transporter